MIPASSRFVVVGAGMHGLSTAYHLAKELAAARHGLAAPTSSSSTRSAPGAGASGIACGVVRNNYFQPAMSELMQACVEVWESDPAAYPTTPSATWRSARRCRRADLSGVLRAPPADRLRLDLSCGRGRGRRAHEGAVPRLARQGRHRLPARAPGRLRLQPRLRARACRPSAESTGVQHPLGRRGHRLRDRRRRHACAPSRPTRGRSRSASRS